MGESANSLIKFSIGTILNSNDESPFKTMDSLFKVVKDLH